jgi:biotin operon repressor
VAAAIRIKLADLLMILSERPGGETTPKPSRHYPFLERDIVAVKAYLQTSGPAKVTDLEKEFDISKRAIWHRLNLLKERGVLVHLPGDKYAILEGRQ